MTTRFSIVGSTVAIDAVPQELEEQLEKATRFRPHDVRYQPHYRAGHWDGYIKLYKRGRFPLGLLGRVLHIWESAHVGYEVETLSSLQQGDEMIACWKGTMRGYQMVAMTKAVLVGSGILRAPTGAGKTMVAVAIAQALARNTLVVVPTVDLLYQFKEMAQSLLGGINVGQLGDGCVDPQEFTVATVRTASRVLGVAYESYEYAELDDEDDTDADAPSLAAWARSLGTLIVDEAQILGAQSVFDLTMALPVAHKFGVSASPWRDDGADLMIEAAVGPVFHRITTKELLTDGFLVPPIVRVLDMKACHPENWDLWNQAQKDDRQKKTYGWVYSRCIVDNEARNQAVADVVNDLVRRGYQTLVLVKQIKHGRALAKLIPGVTFVWGSTAGEVRQQVYQAMRGERKQVLIASTIADMGLDIPTLGALVLAGGGKSSTRHLQRVGRICRPAPGKTHGLVVDFDDSAAHGKWFGEHLRQRLRITKAEWPEVVIHDF